MQAIGVSSVRSTIGMKGAQMADTAFDFLNIFAIGMDVYVCVCVFVSLI